MKSRYILVYPDGGYLGVDYRDECLPFNTHNTSPKEVEYFYNRESALMYRRSFEKLNLRVARIDFTVTFENE